jgi:hypothetical protein
VTISPRERSSPSAAVTVVGLTPSSLASARTEGSGSPGRSAPSSIARSTLAAICAALSPRMRYCAVSNNLTVL